MFARTARSFATQLRHRLKLKNVTELWRFVDQALWAARRSPDIRKRKIWNGEDWIDDNRARELRAGMEMVGACGRCDLRCALRGGTCRFGCLRLCRLSNAGWPLLRDARGRSLLYRTWPRQLGGRRGAVCLPPFSWRGTLRAAKRLRSAISSKYRGQRDLEVAPRLVCFESAALCLR